MDWLVTSEAELLALRAFAAVLAMVSLYVLARPDRAGIRLGYVYMPNPPHLRLLSAATLVAGLAILAASFLR